VEKTAVAVVDESEIFRRGLIVSLSEDSTVSIVFEGPTQPLDTVRQDVAIMSCAALLDSTLAGPVVLCADDFTLSSASIVSAVLPRRTLTPQQLLATVHAVSSGLTVQVHAMSDHRPTLDPRRLQVLRLLADGAGTQEISNTMKFSERTIKGLISDVEALLGARNRPQAVAMGIRTGLI
jgi:DNA-binding NarL/FixJ family response regulator